MTVDAMVGADVRSTTEAVLDHVERCVVGQRRTARLALIAAIAGGHLLVQDAPGSGKTTLGRALAAGIGGQVSRVQGTADLLPGDITGSSVWNPADAGFRFIPGPVFSTVLFVDEFNRMPPRTQSALLEAMEERRVTVDGHTYALPDDFVVIATQNPSMESGTYPVGAGIMDRFAVRAAASSLTPADEARVVSGIARGEFGAELPVAPMTLDLVQARVAARSVFVADVVAAYVVSVMGVLRTHPRREAAPSVRASATLIRAAQALALMRDRAYVIPDDIIELAPPVLAHRVFPHQDAGLAEQLVSESIATLPVPVPTSS
jgi:MoxR-like ATPase